MYSQAVLAASSQKVACREGIAYSKGVIDEKKMRLLANPMQKNQYGQYLLQIVEELKRTGNPNI